jgi:capsular exopolysaccharide synthesis family protein
MSKIFEVLTKKNAQTVEQTVVEQTVDYSHNEEFEKFDVHQSLVQFPPFLFDSSKRALADFECLYKNILITGGSKAKTIMLTSCCKEAGTTTVAMNLAAYSAVKNATMTLLIEANLNSPRLFRYQEGASHEGFYEFLVEQGPVENYVMRSSISSLYVINSGKITGSFKEALTSVRVDRVFNECRYHFPLILIDSPPLESEGCIELARYVDAVIIVVRPHTLAEKVEKAKTDLEFAQANILGVVLNKW